MSDTYIAKAVVTIHALPAAIWDALTRPELIKQYMFGTDVSTDWEVGSPITYRGEWKGESYEDKGTIVQIEPEQRLVSTLWSSASGMADLPENYKTVSYELSAERGGTKVTVTQDNNRTQGDADHSERNWNMVLGKLKALLE